MPTSPRRRIETTLLAILALASVIPLRFPMESRSWFVAEFATLALLLGLALLSRRALASVAATETDAHGLRLTLATLFAVTPICFAVLTRLFGSPIVFELSALSTFGTFSLALAVAAKTERTRAMSLVTSGFLVLFATSISDAPKAVVPAVVWLGGCVWHLVANHWEKLDVCFPDSVRPTVGVRPASVLVAVALCLAGGLAVRNRFGPSDRFAFGIMPTSGGSQWSDPAARSGTGTGDAAIAAKDHAQSFGAVESEMFLESTESTLFDMFNDMIGEPKKKKNKWELRQAMGNENFTPMHERTGKTEKGSASFSTDRMPPPPHRDLGDAQGDAVVQWDGPTGIRLAMQRFDTFDGVEWTSSADLSHDELNSREIDQRVWFFAPGLLSKAFDDSDSVSVNLLKVLKLDSPRVPAPMMTAGLHVKDVDRQDFFAIDDDGSLFMPGRDKVPPLTIFHLASINVMEDELVGHHALASGSPSTSQRWAHALRVIELDGSQSPYAQLQAIVQQLRTEFTFDRQAAGLRESPIEDFFETRRGGDHLFATAAALKAREIGLQSRLVTGFYVRPDSFDMTAGHASVTREDVHAWVEIKLNDGRWFAIEPTPGFRQPVYTPSLWLVGKRFAAAHWMHALLALAASGLCYLTRLIWIEWLLTAVWALSRLMPPKRQLGLAMRIVETRAKLVGNARPVGKPQRDWLESLVICDVQLHDRVRQFCDLADQAIFGENGQIDRGRLNSVVLALKTKQLRLGTREVSA